uniref:Uncharacterized protein n=1 Tax=Chromera velia CCMP2878 TaxID=1169474 RepID=A0A0G4IBT0_9ALVE|eukprot:Cvel_12921.t1-p1 / transcript=Cvel_12921.t1 / gene=Cvel_12921 / organism=Chromera_velia_CCMP2878 / gene_product=hypothetical protein / transcript_product=hypothetical protein / location=Cvel_scaffold863:58690-60557(-) / protein_length=237 / sequence_SO=supercontig / SO=protein_coding / is_pseudo=false
MSGRIEYREGEAIGVGDRLRFRCELGTLWVKESDQKADEQFSIKGVECQWDSSDGPERIPVFRDLKELFECRGCTVPLEWREGKHPKGSRYTVETLSIRRAAKDEIKSFQQNDTKKGVAINDTLFFTCPEGGELRVAKKARVRGGATCVNPLRREEFDLEVSDVKCVRSTGAVFLDFCLWAVFALLLAVAFWVFIWYGWKEKWRRRRIARRLNLQRLVVPPESADVSEMVREALQSC